MGFVTSGVVLFYWKNLGFRADSVPYLLTKTLWTRHFFLTLQDSKGTVALLYSIRYHRSLNAAILLDHKADPLAVSNTKTCLHDAGFHDNLP